MGWEKLMPGEELSRDRDLEKAVTRAGEGLCNRPLALHKRGYRFHPSHWKKQILRHSGMHTMLTWSGSLAKPAAGHRVVSDGVKRHPLTKEVTHTRRSSHSLHQLVTDLVPLPLQGLRWPLPLLLPEYRADSSCICGAPHPC